MKIAIISGTHRADGQSTRVAKYIESRAKTLKKGLETYMLDLGQHPLPLWDESMWGKEGPAKAAWQPVSKNLMDCDAAIVIAPEYNGTAPAALKNFFHFLSGQELGHKAGLLVGVSASINGAYPVAELRASSYKNCKICYMPDHLIVRNVDQVLHDTPRDGFGEQDEHMKKRIDYTLNVFFEYTQALNAVRKSEYIQNVPAEFAYGQ